MTKEQLDNLDENFESFLSEADSIQKDVEFLEHQMGSTLRTLEKVNKRIAGLQNHPMFDHLPDEMKQNLFNIKGAYNEIKSKL